MADGTFIIENGVVVIDGVDLSDHIQSCEVTMTQEDVDATVMVAAGTPLGTIRRAGKRDDMFSMTALSDFAAGSLHATLFPLFRDKDVFTVEVRAFDEAAAVNNPVFEGSCILTSYAPISGGVGELATMDLEFPVSGVIAERTTGT